MTPRLNSRRKGRRGELDALALLVAHGIGGTLRYEQPAMGGADGDIATALGNFEVKRRARFPDYLKPHAGVRAVIFREDRGDWLVVVRAEDYLGLLEGNKSDQESRG